MPTQTVYNTPIKQIDQNQEDIQELKARTSNQNISQFVNDVPYLTDAILDGYATEDYVDEKVQDLAPSSEVDNKITAHNNSPLSHQDIRQAILDHHDSTKYDASNPSGYLTETQVDTRLATKQDKLTAGDNITIVDNVISASSGTTYVGSNGILVNGNVISPDTDILATTQHVGNKIAEHNTSDLAHDDIRGAINGKQDILTAGDGIYINSSNVISASVGAGLFFDDQDRVCLNAATRNTLAAVATKADLVDGKVPASQLPVWDGGNI